MPDVSVIMSVYWETTLQLQRAIDSILQQSFVDFEFVIVLDKPDNLEAKRCILKNKKRDKRIVFLENKKNIKLWASLNKGIQIAKGRYIARMDGDDICDKNKLNKQYIYLEKNKQVDLLFTGWREIDEKGDIQTRIPTQKDFKNIHKTFFYKSPLLHASMMCKKDVFDVYSYPEIDRPEDFSLFLNFLYHWYIYDVLEEDLYTFFIQNYDLDTKYHKIRVFCDNYLGILFKNMWRFKNNIYFWWMIFLVILQWWLTRNIYIFKFLFWSLQKAYKALFQ